MSEIKLQPEVAKKYSLNGVTTPSMITSEKHGRKTIVWETLTVEEADALSKLPGFKYLKENLPPGPAPKN
jgi:hypothetical protein